MELLKRILLIIVALVVSINTVSAVDSNEFVFLQQTEIDNTVYDVSFGQTIHLNTSIRLSKISIFLTDFASTKNINMTIWDSPAKAVRYASQNDSISAGTPSGIHEFNYSDVLLSDGNYYIEGVCSCIGHTVYTDTGNPYSMGSFYFGGIDSITSDMYFIMYGKVSLITPVNNSITNKLYPPLTDNVNFTWTLNPTQLSSNIIVAKDSNFNLIAVDTTTTNNYSVQALEAGTYWWKVRYYNATTGTYYPYSNVSNFTLNNTQSTAGTAIQGIVYEVLNGVEVPVSGALVTLANNFTTQTQTMLTGSNGYYLFTGLTNQSTYYVKASRSDIYKDSPIEYVTTGLGAWTTKNILLQRCTSDYDCGNNQHYVSFYVQDIHYQPYPDVTVSITNYGEVTPIYSGTTGTDGVYQVRLIKNQKYTITFTYGADTVTWNNYFPSDAYTVTLGTLPTDFQYNITGSTAQFVVMWSNLVGTVNMTIRNTTAKVYRQGNTSTSAGGQFSFIVQNTTDIYYLYFNASTDAGDVNTSRVYDYRGSSAHPIGRNWSYGTFSVSQEYKNYISYLLIIILSGTFGALYAPLGGVILILAVAFFVWYEWLVVAGISSAFVGGIAVIIIVRYLQTKDGE